VLVGLDFVLLDPTSFLHVTQRCVGYPFGSKRLIHLTCSLLVCSSAALHFMPGYASILIAMMSYSWPVPVLPPHWPVSLLRPKCVVHTVCWASGAALRLRPAHRVTLGLVHVSMQCLLSMTP
jgi:hypothetical protein